MNPAALNAIFSGDLANAIIASTPGGIEAQERAGQASLVASGARLPKKINRGLTREQVTAATGIQFGADADDLFVTVTLPPGWKLQATDHSMHSDLLDASGSKRAGIFYKASLYDRKANISFNPRYSVRNDYAEPTSKVEVQDTKTGEVLFTSEPFAYSDWNAARAAEEEATAWLEAKHPEYANPLAYWD